MNVTLPVPDGRPPRREDAAGLNQTTAERGAAQRSRMQRRKFVVNQLATAAAALEAFDELLAASPSQGPDATEQLRSAVRELLPLAVQTPDFDVTVTVAAPPGPGARIHHGERGVSVELLAPTGTPAPRATVVTELAQLLRTGGVRTR